MKKLIIADIYKLKKSTMLKIVVFYQIFLIPCAMTLLGLEESTGSFAFEIVFSLSLGITMIYSFMLGTDIVSDFSFGYMRDSIVHGYSRSKILLSRCLIYSIVVAITSFIFPIGLTLTCTLLNGFGDTLPTTYVLRSIMVFPIYAISYSSLTSLIAFSFKRNGPLLGSLMFFVIANNFMTSAENPIIAFIYKYSIFGQIQVFVSQTSTSYEYLGAILISLFTILGSTLLGIYIFNKTDIE